MIKFLKRNGNLLFLILEVLLAIIGTWALVDTIFFITTKKETDAKVMLVERLPLPSPYKVTLEYYNEYIKKDVRSYVDNIDGIYGKKIPGPKGVVKIYYRKYFPHEIYLVGYKFPNGGYVVLECIFLIIMSAGIYFQTLNWREPLNDNEL